MNIIFLTLLDIRSIWTRDIYEDLLREFVKVGDNVYIVSPTESRNGEITHFIEEEKCKILKVHTGNIQKTNLIEKSISTLLLEGQFVNAIKRYLSDVKFDLVLYSTPPITLANAVEYIKKRDDAKTYLLLKDIFPQNAVDMEMMSRKGIEKPIYELFRNKEKKLYNISDRIGCMSPANVKYVLDNNPYISNEKVEVCPNSVEPIDMSVSYADKRKMREKYGIPQDKTVFVYGGNLGKPQGIPFLIECLQTIRDNKNVFFLIVGDGTEFDLISKYIIESKQENVKLMKRLPKDDYDRMVGSCDIGMLFLDHRFTIPNFPSRILSYMQSKLPVLAVTDTNTDIGKIIVEGEFGWWCESDNAENFFDTIELIGKTGFAHMGEKAYTYLCENYSASESRKKIMRLIGE